MTSFRKREEKAAKIFYYAGIPYILTGFFGWAGLGAGVAIVIIFTNKFKERCK